MRLNLGCGCYADQAPDVVNLDSTDYPGVQVVHDLDVYPWPFADQEFTEVRGVQLFEHVIDPIAFMRECWRVLQPGGLLLLIVPHWQSENSHTDPTHRRHCTERTFDYWCEGTPLHSQFGPAYAAGCTFTRERVVVSGQDIHAHLRRI